MGGGGMVYSIKDGNIICSHANHRGDVIARSDSTGSLTSFALYEAYGTRSHEWGEDPDRQKANTKEEESDLGLLNEGMRFRDLETGVFLTRDPIGYGDGPNVYCYVHCNPITSFDAFGLKEGDWWDPRSYKTLPQELWNTTRDMGVRTALGIKETGLIGSDLIAYGAASACGYGGEFGGQSQLFQEIGANPEAYDSDQLRNNILKGTGKEIVNVGTLGLYGIAEGFGKGFATGDFSSAQDRSLQALLLSTQAKNLESRGMNAWTGKSTGNVTAKGWFNKGAEGDAGYRCLSLKKQGLYEMGQQTVKYFNELRSADPISRGMELISRNGGGLRGVMMDHSLLVHRKEH